MANEFRAAGEKHLIEESVLAEQGFAAYVEWLRRARRGEAEGLPPRQVMWAMDADGHHMLGISCLQHPLTPWMAEFAGHIGYRVRPSVRRRGLGSRILALTLQRAKAAGVAPAVMVCLPDNRGSIGVLRNNGASFEREVMTHGIALHRYLAPTEAPPGR